MEAGVEQTYLKFVPANVFPDALTEGSETEHEHDQIGRQGKREETVEDSYTLTH